MNKRICKDDDKECDQMVGYDVVTKRYSSKCRYTPTHATTCDKSKQVKQ
jgi:hypothetical protein